MGIDCTLLPVEADHGSWGYAHSMLDLDRDYEAWKHIENLQPYPRPAFKLNAYCARIPDGSLEGESCYGEVSETPYGELLTYVDSLALAEVLMGSVRPRNNAAGHYLAKIPRTTVAIYWH